MSHVWPDNTLFHTWDRCLFILVDSRLKIGLEKKGCQIQAESSDFILNPEYTFWKIVILRTTAPASKSGKMTLKSTMPS